MSLPILVSATASVASAPWKKTKAVTRGHFGELVGGRLEPVAGDVGDRAHMSSDQPSGALSPVPTAVPPMASLRQIAFERAFDPGTAALELRRIS